MGAFNWITSFLPGFGSSEVVWNDVVTPKLTHLYIPSIYETIQVSTSYLIINFNSEVRILWLK